MIIGICDYGIGGVSLYKRLRERSDVDVIYYSDAGYVPYGKVPEDELRQQVQKVIDFLFDQGAEYVAVACNAASTVLPKNPRVSGIIEHGLQVVRSAEITKTGVVGGYRTIESNSYKTPLELDGIAVKQVVAQALSIRIEAGDLNSAGLHNDIQAIFSPLVECDTVLLACTHYPVIAEQINAAFPNLTLLDPIDEMLEQLCARLPNMKGTNRVRWMTSGDCDVMKLAIDKAFNLTNLSIEKHVL